MALRELLEDGGGSRAPPPRYIQAEPDRPELHPPPTCPLPIVDLSLPDKIELHSALRTRGLFQVVGHGIPSALLHRLLQVTREFFQSPHAKEPGNGGEGYGVDSVVDDEQVMDWSERLYLLVHPEEERNTALWPDEPACFRETLLEYSDKCWPVAKKIMQAMGEALGLGESYLVDRFGEKGMVYERFNHFPPSSRPDLVMGLKAHTDASALTLVLQDPEVEGLHVLDEESGRWVGVPSVPGALLVNVGDQMQIISNGIYKSPFHRVVANAEKERVSVVSFYSMPRDEEIGPAAALVGEERPRMYRNVLVKDYLQSFYQNFPRGKRAIDSVKA